MERRQDLDVPSGRVSPQSDIFEAYRLGFEAAKAKAADIVNDARGTSFDLRGIVADIRAIPMPLSDARAAVAKATQSSDTRGKANTESP